MSKSQRPAFVGRHYQVIYQGDLVRLDGDDHIGTVRHIPDQSLSPASDQGEILVDWHPPYRDERVISSSSRVHAGLLELVLLGPDVTTEHPTYLHDPERDMRCGDRVANGTRRGRIVGIATGERTRIRVAWVDGGFSDERPELIQYDPEPPKVTRTLELPVDIGARFDRGSETDADVLALADAWRRSLPYEDDESVCEHGLLTRACVIDSAPDPCYGEARR